MFIGRFGDVVMFITRIIERITNDLKMGRIDIFILGQIIQKSLDQRQVKCTAYLSSRCCNGLRRLVST